MSTQEQNHTYEQIGVAMTCRSFDEYMRMFALKPDQLKHKKILDIAGGASSFTADARALGFDAEAIDPLYELSATDIRRYGEKEYLEASEKIRKLAHVFDWTYYGNYENYHRQRQASLERFIKSYECSRAAQDSLYRAGTLPHLEAGTTSYELIVCSHFLFLYHEQFDVHFHQAAIQELLRLCKPQGEIRMYPVMTLAWKPYPHMGEIIAFVESQSAKAELIASELPFIPDSTHLLRITKN